MGYFIGSLIVSAASAVLSTNQQRKASNRAEEAARLQAMAQEKELEYQTWAHNQETEKLLASQKAAFASMGMSLDEEDMTPMSVLAETRANRNTELTYLREGGALAVQGYKAQAAGYADVSRMSLVTGGLQLAGAAVSGYAKYHNAQKTGLFE